MVWINKKMADVVKSCTGLSMNLYSVLSERGRILSQVLCEWMHCTHIVCTHIVCRTTSSTSMIRWFRRRRDGPSLRHCLQHEMNLLDTMKNKKMHVNLISYHTVLIALKIPELSKL